MSPMSAMCRAAQLRRLALAVAGVLALAACANEPTTSAAVTPAPKSQPKPVCSAPPPIQDIWKLEPMLTEQGTITAEMTREQKEAAIRAYIRKKNESFLTNCQEKK